MRFAVIGSFSALIAALAYLLAWPVPIDPVAWDPPLPRDLGETAQPLAFDAVFDTPGTHGPEDVHVLPDGTVVGGTADGALLAWSPAGGVPRVLARTGGRPLGLHLAPDGRLLVADAMRGLLAVDVTTGAVEVLCTEVDGRPLVFADDLDVTRDGVVYLSDASDRFTQPDWRLDLLEGRPRGRLVRFDLATGASSTVLDGLYFANGVALAADASFVLVNETSRYRVRRLWLTGPRAGEDEVWIDALPGFPDGISRGPDGRFWLALASPRQAIVDTMAPHPWLRRAAVRLPRALQPGPVPHAQLLGLDASGRVLVDRVTPDSRDFAVVTSVHAEADALWLGSLSWPGVARVALP